MTASPRVLVIGAGSIGRRHVQAMAGAGAAVTVTDVSLDRAESVAAGVDGARAIASPAEMPTGFDGIVIATPTSLHAPLAERAVATGAKVLVEKPLAASTDDAERIAALAEGRVAVGYNLRFHPPVRQTIELVLAGRVGRPLSYRLWFGGYLPDWRPGVDYRATYSARRALGGGILLDAIHELDLAVWLAGAELGVAGAVAGAVVSRVGDLEIDVEDTVHALLRTPAGVPVEVSLDYLSRRYRRGIEVVGTDATIRLDWARGVIEVETADAVETLAADAPVAESYVRQAEAFVGWLGGGPPLPVDAATGAVSVALADAIRAAAA